MKNLKNLSYAIVIMAAFVVSFSSCTDPLASDITATATIDKTLAHNGDVVAITIDASTTNDKITSVTLVKDGNSLTVPAVTDDKAYLETINYTVADADGELEFTITVSTENSIDPVVKTVYLNVVTNVTINLGASSSSKPSFFNGTTLATYNAAAAFADQASVDLVYTYSTTDGAIIGAPSDASFVLANWTTKNTTKIAKITEETAAAVAGVTGTAVKGLVVGDLLGYITVSGTKGIIKVMAITVGASGEVTLTLMVIK